MFFSGRRIRALEALVALQRSEISDLRVAMRDERSAFAAERKDLLDRLLVCTQPAAHRELHPRAPRAQKEGSYASTLTHRRIHFPGFEKSFRPPYPAVPREVDPPAKREETPS